MELWSYHARDIQTELPQRWCEGCGQEIYPGEPWSVRNERVLCRSCTGQEREFQSLRELSKEYAATAKALKERIRLVRQLLQNAVPEETWALQQRLASLRDIQKYVNEIAQITAHYYDREDVHDT